MRCEGFHQLASLQRCRDSGNVLDKSKRISAAVFPSRIYKAPSRPNSHIARTNEVDADGKKSSRLKCIKIYERISLRRFLESESPFVAQVVFDIHSLNCQCHHSPVVGTGFPLHQ